MTTDRDRILEQALKHELRAAGTSPAGACLDAETLGAWTNSGLEPTAMAAVEAVRCTPIDPAQSGKASDQQRAALFARAFVAADEGIDSAEAEVEPSRIGSAERKHCPALVGIAVVHAADRADPARGLTIVPCGEHRGDELGRVLLQFGIRRDACSRAGNERPRGFLLKRSLADRPDPSHRREPGFEVTPNEGQANLPGVSLRNFVGIGRVINERVKINESLGGKDPETRRDPGRFQPVLRRQQRSSSLPCANLRSRRLEQSAWRSHSGRGGQTKAPGVQPIDGFPFDRDRSPGIGPGANHLIGKHQVNSAHCATTTG